MRSEKGEWRGGNGGGYARVYIDADLTCKEFLVEIALDDHEWNDQIRHGGFEEWKNGALYGVHYALTSAGINSGKWRIRRIVGLVVDTTPTFLAFAASQAVWRVLDYKQSIEHKNRMKEVARNASWERLEHFPDL